MSSVTRSIPSYLAPVVEELELDQASLVTMDDLRRIVNAKRLNTDPAKIAAALRERGWLLATGTKGVWEFAPGAHAGPFGRGHPFRAVQAAMLANPDIAVRVCLSSALWAHGLLDRTPERPEVSVAPGTRVPKALNRDCRVVKFEAHLPAVLLRDVPVDDLATVLVHLAAVPTDVRSWGPVMELLPTLVDAAVETGGLDPLIVELTSRPASVRTRLAYLIHGVAPEIAEAIATEDHGVVWFGRRDQDLKRFDSAYRVADTVLPIAPGGLRPVDDAS